MRKILAVFLLLLLVAGCKQKREVKEGRKVLRVVMYEPESVDPAFIDTQPAFQIAANLFEGLFRKDESDSVQPALVEKYEVSDDGLRWTFYLKEGVEWSNGREITAYDFEYAWKRILNPKTGSPGADALFLIEGAEEFYKSGKGEIGVFCEGPKVLKVTLRQPEPYFPYILTSPRFAPVPKEVVEKYPKEWTRPDLIVTNGAYILKEWKKRQELVLEKNKNYWDAKSVQIERVEVRFTKSEENALAWFRNGEVDLVLGLVPLGKVPLLKREFEHNLVVLDAPRIGLLVANVRKEKSVASSLRRAIYWAVDRKKLVDDVMGGVEQVAYGWVPKLLLSSKEAKEFKCKQKETSKEEKRAIELLSNSSETLRTMMEFIQSDLKEDGIQVNLQLMEWKSFLASVKRGDFELARWGLAGGPDPLDFLVIYTSDHPGNVAGLRDGKFDDLIRRAQAARSVEEREALIVEAEKELCRVMPAIPLYFSSEVMLARETIRGLTSSRDGIHEFRLMKVEGK